MNRKISYFFMMFIAAALVLTCGLSTEGVSAADNSARGINVMTPTEQQIRNHAGHKWEEVDYDVDPSFRTPYRAGRLSEESLEEALDVVNLMRFIAGVPDDVELSPRYNNLAQSATLINCINNRMSYYPDKPVGMEDSLFIICAEGARSCNLGMGYTDLPSAIHGWMNDGDQVNADTVGHRRWILNPSMEETGFGQVENQTAMYVFDNETGDTPYYGVAWPAQTMPYEFFEAGEPWSISMGYKVNNDAVVTLKRLRDNKTWTFSEGSNDYYIENSKYGRQGCLIFRPRDVGAYKPGDVYEVTITGSNIDVYYQVKFFSVYADSNNAGVTSVRLNQRILHMYTSEEGGSFAKLDATVLPAGNKVKVSWTSSDKNVLTVDDNGVISVVGHGTATVTASAGLYSDYCYIIVTTDISDVDVVYPSLQYEYTGSEIKPQLKLKYHNQTLIEGYDYIVTYENNLSAGTGRIVFQGIEGFSGEDSIEFTISPKTIANSMISDIPDQQYTGREITPILSFPYGCDYLIEGRDYKLTFFSNIESGVATVEIKGQGNYTGTVAKHFAIQRAGSPTVVVDKEGAGTTDTTVDADKAEGQPVEPGIVVEPTEETVKPEPAKQKISVKTSSKTIKYSTTKKQATSFKITSVTDLPATLEYKLTKSPSSKITVTKKGTVKIAKGLKKGTYKITVKVTSLANEQAKKATKTVQISIKVK